MAEKLLAKMEHKSAKPLSHKSYSLVIKAWAISNAVDAVERAWNVMHKLGYPHIDNSIPFRLTVHNFNAMLKLFATRGMAKEAEALLSKMDEFIVDGIMKIGGPNMQSYEAVLEALGRCRDADAPSRAEALVTRLEVLSEMGGIGSVDQKDSKRDKDMAPR